MKAVARFLSLTLLLLLSACTPLPEPAHRVILITDGEKRVLETGATTVGEVLEEAGVELGALDRVRPPETAQVEEADDDHHHPHPPGDGDDHRDDPLRAGRSSATPVCPRANSASSSAGKVACARRSLSHHAGGGR